MMISKSTSSLALERTLTMLRRIALFCENEVDCRRKEISTYFNETIEECGGSNVKCDNCSRDANTFDVISLTTDCVTMLDCVDAMADDKTNITLHKLAEFLGGKKTIKNIDPTGWYWKML